MKKTFSAAIAAMALLLILAAASCRTAGNTAGRHTVTTTADSGLGSLRDTLTGALDGDEVTFKIPKHAVGYDAASRTWTITLTGGEIVFEKSLTLKGGGTVILDGNAAGRILNYGGDRTLTLDGLTFRNGNTAGYWPDFHGGAVYAYGSVIADFCEFTNNTAEADGTIRANGYGGAVYANGSIEAHSCMFAGNTADGGGAVNADGPVTVEDCAFTGNRAIFAGGAARSDSGPVTAIGCRFASNLARNSSGGAVYAEAGPVAVSRCTFSGNKAVEGGAAAAKGDITAEDCAFIGNRAEYPGGAVYVPNNLTQTGFTVTATNCSFAGNAAGIGGAVYARNSVTADCAFLGNTAKHNGGAVYTHNDVIALNTVFTGNRITDNEHAGVVQVIGGAYLYHTTVADNTGTGVFISRGSKNPRPGLYAYNSIIAGNSAATQAGHGVRGKTTVALSAEDTVGDSLIEGISDGVTRAAVFGENKADDAGVISPLFGGLADKAAAALIADGIAVPDGMTAAEVFAALREDITGAARPAEGKVSYGARE